eukprot:6491512-Amphidinium_carterae.2
MQPFRAPPTFGKLNPRHLAFQGKHEGGALGYRLPQQAGPCLPQASADGPMHRGSHDELLDSSEATCPQVQCFVIMHPQDRAEQTNVEPDRRQNERMCGAACSGPWAGGESKSLRSPGKGFAQLDRRIGFHRMHRPVQLGFGALWELGLGAQLALSELVQASRCKAYRSAPQRSSRRSCSENTPYASASAPESLEPSSAITSFPQPRLLDPTTLKGSPWTPWAICVARRTLVATTVDLVVDKTSLKRCIADLAKLPAAIMQSRTSGSDPWTACDRSSTTFVVLDLVLSKRMACKPWTVECKSIMSQYVALGHPAKRVPLV